MWGAGLGWGGQLGGPVATAAALAPCCFPVLQHSLPIPLPSCLPPTTNYQPHRSPASPSHTCIHSLPRLPQVDATVKSWNVKILGLNRQSRHRDATMAQEFWRMLDTHLQARGSTLAY